MTIQRTPNSELMALEYLYRDANNFKAHGTAWLTGHLSKNECNELISSLESGEFFIAEQVQLAPLQSELFAESNGATVADHAWHSFISLSEVVDLPVKASPWGSAQDLLALFLAASGNWKPNLSPYYDC